MTGGIPLSAIALLYPIASMLYIATATPAPPLTVLGYGLSSLGYVLLAAGLVAGTFRALHLKRRGHVLLAASLTWAAGVVLSNL